MYLEGKLGKKVAFFCLFAPSQGGGGEEKKGQSVLIGGAEISFAFYTTQVFLSPKKVNVGYANFPPAEERKKPGISVLSALSSRKKGPGSWH